MGERVTFVSEGLKLSGVINFQGALGRGERRPLLLVVGWRMVGRPIALALAILVAPPFAEAQRPGKIPRIGYLRSTSSSDAARYGEALRQGLRDLGYLEGQHFTMETRAAEGHYERLPGLAAELVHLPVDLIVAGGTPAIRAAKDATNTIPIVMAVSTDPIGAGLIAGLAHPGGNVTGVSLGAGEQFAGKWVQLLK